MAAKNRNASPAKTQKRPEFRAMISGDQVKRAEEAAQSFGVWRRTALSTLAQNSDRMLRELADEKTAEAFLDAVEGIGEYLIWLRAHTEGVEAAHARIFMVLNYLHADPATTEGGGAK